MADIAGLMSGSDLGRLFAAEGVHADQLAQAREWCQAPPDRAAIQWLTVTLGARRRRRVVVPGAGRESA